jgi:hypothetical protein
MTRRVEPGDHYAGGSIPNVYEAGGAPRSELHRHDPATLDDGCLILLGAHRAGDPAYRCSVTGVTVVIGPEGRTHTVASLSDRLPWEGR